MMKGGDEMGFGRIGMKGTNLKMMKGNLIWKNWNERELVFGRIEMKGN